MAKDQELLAAAEIECLQDAPEYRAHEREASKSGRDFVMHRIAQGDMLRKWKDKLGHGVFLKFLDSNFSLSERTARLYMKVSQKAEEIGNRQTIAVLNIDPTVDYLLSYSENKEPEKPNRGGKKSSKKDESKASEASPDGTSLHTVPAASTEDYGEEEDIPVTVEECMLEAAGDIEKFCRYILKEWKDKMPRDPWLDHKGLSDSAGQAIKSALATMRLAKCTNLCPKCDWDSKCKTCLGTGRIPKRELNQLG